MVFYANYFSQCSNFSTQKGGKRVLLGIQILHNRYQQLIITTSKWKKQYMKKFILGITLLICTLSPVMSQTLEENCGCGLGVMLFEGQDGILSQTLAITTNGLFMNNFFGITSGTLGCEPADGIVSIDRINIFVAGNMDGLAKDIAVGKGEVLDTLAELMNVSDSNRPEMYQNLRANFAQIYSSEDIEHTQIVENILQVTNS